jgi:hypothetical protein
MNRLHNVIEKSPVSCRRTPEHLITQEYQGIRPLFCYTLHYLGMLSVALFPKLYPRRTLLVTDNSDAFRPLPQLVTKLTMRRMWRCTGNEESSEQRAASSE